MSEERQPVVVLLAPTLRRAELRDALRPFGRVLEADTPDRVRHIVRQEHPELVMLHLGGGDDILSLCTELDQALATRVVVIGPDSDIASIRAAMQAGARDYLGEPITPEELQATLARLVQGERRTRRGKVVTVFGTKGGVGKSTVAANLAVVLADRHRQRVAIVDLDLEFGCAATLFGAHPGMTIVDICRRSGALNLAAIEEALTRSAHSSVEILASPPTPDLAAFVDGEGKREPDRNYVQEILRVLRASYDWVIVDTAVDFGEAVITALDEAERILFVTTPDVPALQNSAKGLDILLERLGYPADKLQVVLNRGNAGIGLSGDEIAQVLDHPILYSLPSDGDVAVRAANLGIPLVRLRGRSALARGIARLGASLVEARDRGRVSAIAEGK
ncbi:MAG: AAA family ATPase [Thermaerobacter sp.]|nr:AAA family ATPase [Thermaerobacter sp.]